MPCNEPTIVGIAVDTMVPSMAVINVATKTLTVTNLTFVSFAICSHPFLFNCQFSKLLHSYSIQKRTNCLKKMLFHKKIIAKKNKKSANTWLTSCFFYLIIQLN